MQRVTIIGSCGAGKSTLARSLGKIISLPIIHLDTYYWQTGWQEINQTKWQKIQQKLVAQECWIIDGNYISTMDIRLAAADTIIWLDFNRYLCLWRIFKRYLEYPGRTRPDMGKECPERLNWEFMQYVWNFSKLHRTEIINQLARYQENKQVFILQNPSQVSDWLNKISKLRH